jgi:ligand-binding SRPBCC domain-containing protein
MNVFIFETELWLPRPRTEVFDFFADAHNLQILTPSFLHFEILTPRPIPMHAGALIDYRLRVHGIPVRWRTKIGTWEPPQRFVDKQIRGPYRQWIHEHWFVEKDGGTLCNDEVRYAVWGGAVLNRLFVRRDVRAIFEFRRKKLLEMFGGGK